MISPIFRVFMAFLIVLCASNARAVTFETMMNNIVRGTPGVSNVVISSGVRATATGAVDVAAGSLVIPVATTVAADVGWGAIAAGGGRVALRAVPYVGAALTLAELGNVMTSSGYKTCPPPDFFCKPPLATGTTYTPTTVKYRYCTNPSTGSCASWHETVADACSDVAVYNSNTPQSDGKTYLTWYVKSIGPAPDYICVFATNGNKATNPNGYDAGQFQTGAVARQYYCNDGSVAVNNSCTVTAIGSDTPVPLDDVNKAIAARLNADHDWGLKMKAQMDAITQANPGLAPVIDTTTAPVTVTAPPVTAAPVVVSTTTIPNADGSTSTQKVTSQTTVTPTISSGGTVANPGVTYPSSTVTTTTTTNNTTNVTSTTTNTTNNTTVAPAVKPTDIPTDYNREATQKLILKELDGSNVNVADPADQNARTNKGLNDTDKSLSDLFTSLPAAMTNEKVNWFSWVWTPPVGQCSPSTYTTTVHGYTVNWDICDMVNKIRDVIGWLFALYAAINVYSNLFKNGGE